MTPCVVCGERAGGKYGGPCSVCGVDTCPRHTYFYTDDSNLAITNSARPRCKTHAI